MTEYELAVIAAFKNVGFQMGSSNKRFAKDMMALAEREPTKELTERQGHYLRVIAWMYRRQMPAALVPKNKPETLSPQKAKTLNSLLRNNMKIHEQDEGDLLL